jgi:chemotaxis receptor (MCP) glutamine deamidase CheD
MGPTPWGAHVIIEGQPWLGHTAADLEWAFPDHTLIASLGCGSCLSIPVRENDQTLGTLNILDAEGRYAQDDLIRASAYAASAIPLLKCV